MSKENISLRSECEWGKRMFPPRRLQPLLIVAMSLSKIMSTNIQILDSVIFPVISCNKDESEAITSRMLEGAGMPQLWEAVRDQNEKN